MTTPLYSLKGVQGQEEWRPVKDFENLYEVSHIGNVKSLASGRILKKCLRHGYETVKLCKNKVEKIPAVHRLVAIAFVNNPNKGPQVNHIDGNKLNNHCNNLEWCTHANNMKHAAKNKLMKAPKGVNNYRAFFTQREVDFIRRIFKPGKLNCTAIAKFYGVHHGTIYDIINNKTYKD